MLGPNIDLRPEREHELERVMKACFDVLVGLNDLGRHSDQVGVEMTCRSDDEEIVLILSRLVPVV